MHLWQTGRPIRSVYLDLHVSPCAAGQQFGASVPVQPLINAHLVRYLVPALLELAQEQKSPLVHVRSVHGCTATRLLSFCLLLF